MKVLIHDDGFEANVVAEVLFGVEADEVFEDVMGVMLELFAPANEAIDFRGCHRRKP